MISLITNIAAQSAQSANKSADRLQSQAMQRLSTGVRVNAAQDDAAGLAIGVRMTSTTHTRLGKVLPPKCQGLAADCQKKHVFDLDLKKKLKKR